MDHMKPEMELDSTDQQMAEVAVEQGMVDEMIDQTTVEDPTDRVIYRRHKYDVGAPVSSVEVPNAQAENELKDVIRLVLASQSGQDTPPQPEPAPKRRSAPKIEYKVPTMPLQATMTPADPAIREMVNSGAAGKSEVALGGVTRETVHLSTKSLNRAGLFKSIWKSLPIKSLLTIGLIAYLSIWQPIYLLAAFVFFATFIVGLYITVGPKRLARGIESNWLWLHERRPELAQRMRGQAQMLLTCFDAVLHVIPGRWTDEIHLPDLSNSKPNVDKVDPFEKLIAPGAE